MNELVEKVARAIDPNAFLDSAWCRYEYGDQMDRQRSARRNARSAILAVLGGIREPSEGMLGAAFSATVDDWSGNVHGMFGEAFRAMIDALLREISEGDRQ